jgi:outer membrane protein OmpA-like peptidoglycan-associated protein
MAAPATKTIQSADLQSAADTAPIEAQRLALIQLALETLPLLEAGMSLGLIDGDPVIRVPIELFFDAESALLKEASTPALNALAQVLLKRDDAQFTLHAHGPRSGALPVLEAARGLGLVNALISNGLPEAQIELAGGFPIDLRDRIGGTEEHVGEALHIRLTPRMENQGHSASAKAKALSLKRDEAKN